MCQRKKIKNRLSFDEVTAMSLMSPFLWDTVYNLNRRLKTVKQYSITTQMIWILIDIFTEHLSIWINIPLQYVFEHFQL